MSDSDTSRGFIYYVSWVLWPGLLAGSVFAVLHGVAKGFDPIMMLFGVYLVLVLCIAFLERAMPHETRWNANDGQVKNDFFYTFFSYIFVGAVAEAAVIAGVAKLVIFSTTLSSGGIWPSDLPVWSQFILLLFVAEVGAYLAHRISHEVPLLWRFHAIHHSAPSLYWFNTGRFHPVDVLETVVLALPLPIILGAPADLMFTFTCFTMFVGVLSHCNIEMRFGILNWIFNTPGVHRWHHSRVLKEGNSNYGENLMLLDVLFRTHFTSDRRPTVVGTGTPVPLSIWGQMFRPFTGYDKD